MKQEMMIALVCDSESFLLRMNTSLELWVLWRACPFCVSSDSSTHAVNRWRWDTSRYLTWPPFVTWGRIRGSSGIAPRGLQLCSHLTVAHRSFLPRLPHSGENTVQRVFTVCGDLAYGKHGPLPTNSGSVLCSRNRAPVFLLVSSSWFL